MKNLVNNVATIGWNIKQGVSIYRTDDTNSFYFNLDLKIKYNEWKDRERERDETVLSLTRVSYLDCYGCRSFLT